MEGVPPAVLEQLRGLLNGFMLFDDSDAPQVAPGRPPMEHMMRATFSGVCSVCQEEVAENEGVCPPNCTHVFHDECISPWLEKSHSCPDCRSEIGMPVGLQPPSVILESLAEVPNTDGKFVHKFVIVHDHDDLTLYVPFDPYLRSLFLKAYERRLLFKVVNGIMVDNAIPLWYTPTSAYMATRFMGGAHAVIFKSQLAKVQCV